MMDLEREKILSLLEQGKINADEADTLLNALDESEAVLDEVYPIADPPDMSRFRQFWKIPFTVALSIFGLSMAILLSLRKARGGTGRFIRFLTWPIAILSLISAMISYWSKNSPWVHVRIQEEDGSRFAVSLPLPLQPVRSGLGIVRQWAPDENTADMIDAASEFLDAVDAQGEGDPLTIEVEDGSSVQVFVG